jgi:hypothetical protein
MIGRLAMPDIELPSGIKRLLTRVTYSCSEPRHVHFRQDLLRKWVAEVADAYENGWTLLREGALRQLADDDANLIECALAVLFVVGKSNDAAAVEPLLLHQNERVQKAARTCLFELRQRVEILKKS